MHMCVCVHMHLIQLKCSSDWRNTGEFPSPRPRWSEPPLGSSSALTSKLWTIVNPAVWQQDANANQNIFARWYRTPKGLVPSVTGSTIQLLKYQSWAKHVYKCAHVHMSHECTCLLDISLLDWSVSGIDPQHGRVRGKVFPPCRARQHLHARFSSPQQSFHHAERAVLWANHNCFLASFFPVPTWDCSFLSFEPCVDGQKLSSWTCWFDLICVC